MSTQALVSVVDPEGVTLLKVVVGRCRSRANPLKLAVSLARTGELDVQEVFWLAETLDMSDVAVLGRDEHYHEMSEMDGVSSRYVATFEDPVFNPRMSHGVANVAYLVKQKQSPGPAPVHELPCLDRPPALWRPNERTEMDNVIQLFRQELVIPVKPKSDGYYMMLGRLAEWRYQAGDSTEWPSKTVQEIAEGK